jgi:hypothetical protein
MKVKIDKAKVFRYRRYGAALLVAAVAWFPYAASTYFIFPSWDAFLITLVLVAGGCVPLVILARHCFAVAEEELAEKRTRYARRNVQLVR